MVEDSGGSTIIIDSTMSITSENPLQNKVVTGQINTLTESVNSKASKSVVTQLSDGLMSATDKLHLDIVYEDYSSALIALGVIEP